MATPHHLSSAPGHSLPTMKASGSKHANPRVTPMAGSGAMPRRGPEQLCQLPEQSVDGNFEQEDLDISGNPDDIREEADPALEREEESSDQRNVDEASHQAERASLAYL